MTTPRKNGARQDGTVIDRRDFLRTTVAGAAVLGAMAPRRARAAASVQVGFLGPLSGAAAPWGLPGLRGAQLWAERLNAAGGIDIGGVRHDVEIIAQDDRYDPDLARFGARKLIEDVGVKFILMLGGETWPAVQPIANEARMLVSTLVPSDLSPASPFLIAPVEIHPIYNVTGVEWLSRSRPALKTAVICAQDDPIGRPSVATYLAAFAAAGISVIDLPLFFKAETQDFGPVMTKLLANKPDILCLDSSYADFVHPLVEAAFRQGYEGQIISCTADFYQRLIERTSKDFMEGFVFQFPDFDDPALAKAGINFRDPNGFFQAYEARWPGDWTALTWEFASVLDVWLAGVEAARDSDPLKVLTGMKLGSRGRNAFGAAEWWGREIYGIDNALLGFWPVVAIEDGKATVKELRSIPDWWRRNSRRLIQQLDAMGELPANIPVEILP